MALTTIITLLVGKHEGIHGREAPAPPSARWNGLGQEQLSRRAKTARHAVAQYLRQTPRSSWWRILVLAADVRPEPISGNSSLTASAFLGVGSVVRNNHAVLTILSRFTSLSLPDSTQLFPKRPLRLRDGFPLERNCLSSPPGNVAYCSAFQTYISWLLRLST